MKRALGWKPSPPDARDHVASERRRFGAAPPPPPSWSNRKLILDILDQGQLGSCVANATAQAVRAAHVREGIDRPPLLSRLALYYLARAFTHDQHQDTGTYTRSACQALAKFGFCPEDVWPYDDTATPGAHGEVPRFARMPSPAAFRAGFDQIAATGPAAYMRITETGTARLDVIKRAIVAGYTVFFGTAVSERFCSVELGPTPQKPPIGEQIAGGHELLVVGYTPEGFDICNSWGSTWNGEGYCTFAPEYLSWSETSDLWVIEAVPSFSQLVKP